VFEEDPSLDVELQEPQRMGDRDRGVKDLRMNPHGTSLLPNTHTRHHQVQLSTSSSAPSLASQAVPVRRSRQGTVSSVNSTGAKSTKSVHPFASTAVRSTSPPPPTSSSKHLAPDSGRGGGMSLSRSQPNLAERYKAESSAMHQPHQVTLVSEEDWRDDEDNCPVCCESLSFTYRLPGEKPHIVPECGHSLHEVIGPNTRLPQQLTFRNALSQSMATFRPKDPDVISEYVEYAVNR
jgi:hypothetical protein